MLLIFENANASGLKKPGYNGKIILRSSLNGGLNRSLVLLHIRLVRKSNQCVLNGVPRRVTSEMNQSLVANYSDEEIKEALFQMDPHTAPGPDGVSPLFFRIFGILWV